MSIPPVRAVRFNDEPLADIKNTRPVYRTESEQFTFLLNRYTRSKDNLKEDLRIKEIAKNKLLEFSKKHPEYSNLLPKELR